MTAPDASMTRPARWPHRLAWALAVAVFPLVWMGGLVTSYGAGMSVPDWPTTYGYWFYPLRLWVAVWDLFLEHGHRMLAQLVGLLAIALAVSIWWTTRDRLLRGLAVAAVVGVLFQGTLGGLRVVCDSLLLAKVHGCTAPLFFCLAAGLVTLTSARYQATSSSPGANRLPLVVTVLVYLQIVLGVQLRQLTLAAASGWFELWVWLHLLNAGLITAMLVWLLLRSSERRRRTILLVVLFLVQEALGAAAWVTKFGWPHWFTDYFWAIEYTVVAGGRWQVWMRSLHTAVGSLVLAAALALTLWSARCSVRLPPTGR